MKKKIALVAGGFTGESVISVKSAAMIDKQIDRNLYDVYRVIIDHEGWYHIDTQESKHIIDKNDFSISLNGNKVRFDIAFIIIHGSPGEDGKLQGYFDMIGLPYTTCDALSSSVTMNKSYTKAIVADLMHIHIAKSVQLFSRQKYSLDELNKQLKYPLFVKTNNGGSSIGMSKVNEPGALQEAIDRAFREDDQIIVEEFIKGREFTVGVVRLQGKVQVLPCTEIVPSKEFFDYEAKYTPGVTDEITPGRLASEERARVEVMGLQIYNRLNCRGVVRVDFIIDEPGNIYFLEINTVPGQTETSLIPQQVLASGMDLKTFYGQLIEESF